MSGFVSVDKHEHIAVVRIERADALNAISGAVADELRTAFEHVAHDDTVWVMALTAAGDKAFCVGADLKERAGFSLDDFYANRKQIRAMFTALRAVPQPTIAAVFGFALGGGFELALSCDLIIATTGTELGLPEARVGLLPAGGGTQLLARKVGVARAKDMIFRGRRIDASEAHTFGLVVEVCDPAALHDRMMDLGRDVCASSPRAVRAAKRAIDAALGVPIEEGIAIENENWKEVIVSADRPEGIAAFNEKRAPRWSNK